MARGKKHRPEQIVSLLRQIEVAVANGKTTAQASKEALITEQTYYRWRKEFGGLQVDQARRLKDLEQENAKLKRLVGELSLDKLVLKDIASGNFGRFAIISDPKGAAFVLFPSPGVPTPAPVKAGDFLMR
jgi:putative transposase